MRVSHAFACSFATWRLHTLDDGVEATDVERNGRFQQLTHQAARARAGSSVSLYCIYTRALHGDTQTATRAF